MNDWARRTYLHTALVNAGVLAVLLTVTLITGIYGFILGGLIMIPWVFMTTRATVRRQLAAEEDRAERYRLARLELLGRLNRANN